MSGGGEARALRVGVVGAGAMGRNHVRLLATMAREGAARVEMLGLFDQDTARAEEIAREFDTVAHGALDDLARDADALVLAVPTVAHADLGCDLLEAGKHLLIEKPLAGSLDEADRLLAAAGDRVLAVGHVEFHNPAVETLISQGLQPRFCEIQRLSPFTARSLDVDVVLDLMIHDLQILHALDPSPVAEIRATGLEVLSPKVDIANVRLELESGLVSNLTASRVSSERVRKLRAFFPNRYCSLDYREQELKGYRLDGAGAESKIVPEPWEVHQAEPLRRELEAFVGACRGEPARVVSGHEGRRALATALEVTAAIAR